MGTNRKISKAQQKFNDEVAEKSLEIAKKIQVKKDMIIVEAITHALGTEVWRMDDPDIISRGRFEVAEDGSQMFYFDDIAMVLFEKSTPEILKEDKEHYFEAGFKCTKIWEIRKENMEK